MARAESGAASAVLGTLTAPGGTGQGALSASAIEVATSRDGRYAFVTLEYDQRAAVFNLADAVSRGFGSADYAGSIPLGQAAAGLAVSPDGRWLRSLRRRAAVRCRCRSAAADVDADAGSAWTLRYHWAWAPNPEATT